MVADLQTLTEVVDQTRIDRKLADAIERDRVRIDEEIKINGYSDLTVDGKIFRITKSATKETAA